MMNKPITYRVKRSPFKQDTDADKGVTVRGKATVKGPDEEFKETRKKTWDDLRKEGWSEAKIKEAKEWRANNPDAPNVGITETKTKKGPDVTATVDEPIYTQDRGDALTAPQQRGVERGLLQSARKTGKFARKAYEGMSDAERAEELGIDTKAADWKKQYSDLGIKNKRQFGRAAKAKANKNALKAQKDFATTQREMAIQGIAPGSAGGGKISTLKGKDFDRQMTKADTGYSEQILRAREKAAEEAKTLAEEMARDNARGNIKMANTISAQQTQPVTFSTPTVSEIQANIQRDINAPRMKSKSPYKMKGYGSKAYKK